MKLGQRIIFYVIIGIWLLVVNYWYFQYKSTIDVPLSIYDDEVASLKILNNDYHQNEPVKIDVVNHQDIKSLVKSLHIKDERKLDSHSFIYDVILKNHQLSDILSLDFKQRCDLYFKNLYLYNNNWFIDPNEDLPLDFRRQFDYDDFKRLVADQVKLKFALTHGLSIDQVKDNDELEALIKEEYQIFWLKTMDVEQRITDSLSHLRIFNKCYITNDNKFELSKISKLINGEKAVMTKSFKLTDNEKLINSNSFHSCNELESRIYRWLSFNYPIYERWTGETFLSPPNLKKFVKHPKVFTTTNSKFNSITGKPIKSDFTNNKPCFLNQFKNSLNGKGIVLSIGDIHVDETVRLIHLLRALNNHYPIQVVYYDSLSQELKRKIVNAAINKMIDLPDSFNKVKQYFPKNYFNVKDGGLPKQEVWFVNTYNAIHNNYRDKFRKFANKFLAALFNSFEEYMLIDADTVLLQNPEFFFNLKNYIAKGAYFYKDRSTAELRPDSDGMFFQKITPSLIDNVVFDIPIITSHTTKLEFFDGMGHFMESGLVMINRHLHFNSILTMVQLNFYNPVTARVYGDKEIFWLGFAANGDENYHFNKYFVASIGEQTPEQDRLTSQGKVKFSKEICSAHPGHINGEDGNSLVWFNSGYKFCGKDIDYETEVSKGERLKFLKTAGEMKKYYQNPIPLRHAIIPPYKNREETVCHNVEEEPILGWIMDRGYCNSYLWCAYSSVGGLTKDGSDNTQIGQFLEFDETSVNLFKYYGDIWVGNE